MYDEHNRVVLAIDFDGTICEAFYPEVGEEMEGAKEYINRLYDEGYVVIINTCRTDGEEFKARSMAECFLKARGIKYHLINENYSPLIDLYGIDCRKISADVYVDDRGLVPLPSWERIYEIIKEKFEEPLKQF